MLMIGSALVTFLPRVLPLIVLSRIELPEWGIRWLNYVPISVMGALVGQELFVQDEQISLLNNIELLAAIPTVLVAMKTKSLLGTVVVGMISIMAVRYFL